MIGLAQCQRTNVVGNLLTDLTAISVPAKMNSIDKRMSDVSDMNARAALYSKDSTPMNTQQTLPPFLVSRNDYDLVDVEFVAAARRIMHALTGAERIAAMDALTLTLLPTTPAAQLAKIRAFVAKLDATTSDEGGDHVVQD